LGNQVEDCMGRVCSTHSTDGKCVPNFERKTWSEETTRKT